QAGERQRRPYHPAKQRRAHSGLRAPPVVLRTSSTSTGSVSSAERSSARTKSSCSGESRDNSGETALSTRAFRYWSTLISPRSSAEKASLAPLVTSGAVTAPAAPTSNEPCAGAAPGTEAPGVT